MNISINDAIFMMACILFYLAVGVGIAKGYDETFADDMCGPIIVGWIVVVPFILVALAIGCIADICMKLLRIK